MRRKEAFSKMYSLATLEMKEEREREEGEKSVLTRKENIPKES
jgi:hypothetical protein